MGVDPFALQFNEWTSWQMKPLWVKLSFCVISIKGSSAGETPDVADLAVRPSFWDAFSEISLLFNQLCQIIQTVRLPSTSGWAVPLLLF